MRGPPGRASLGQDENDPHAGMKKRACIPRRRLAHRAANHTTQRPHVRGLTHPLPPVTLSLVSETTDKRLTDYADCAG